MDEEVEEAKEQGEKEQKGNLERIWNHPHNFRK